MANDSVIVFRLPKKHCEELDIIAKKYGVSVAHILRRLVRTYLVKASDGKENH